MYSPWYDKNERTGKIIHIESNLNEQIEQEVSRCETCRAMRKEPPKAQIHPCSFPTKAWSRIHIDYAGPVNSAMYLVIVDAYSKFPEGVKMSSTTSKATIQVLHESCQSHD